MRLAWVESNFVLSPRFYQLLNRASDVRDHRHIVRHARDRNDVGDEIGGAHQVGECAPDPDENLLRNEKPASQPILEHSRERDDVSDERLEPVSSNAGSDTGDR